MGLSTYIRVRIKLLLNLHEIAIDFCTAIFVDILNVMTTHAHSPLPNIYCHATKENAVVVHLHKIYATTYHLYTQTYGQLLVRSSPVVNLLCVQRVKCVKQFLFNSKTFQSYFEVEP